MSDNTLGSISTANAPMAATHPPVHGIDEVSTPLDRGRRTRSRVYRVGHIRYDRLLRYFAGKARCEVSHTTSRDSPIPTQAAKTDRSPGGPQDANLKPVFMSGPVFTRRGSYIWDYDLGRYIPHYFVTGSNSDDDDSDSDVPSCLASDDTDPANSDPLPSIPEPTAMAFSDLVAAR